MRYMFQEHHSLAPEIARAFYELALRWAAAHGTAFVITLYTRDHRSPVEVERFAALGTASWRRGREEEVVEITGAIGEELIDTLFQSPMPERAISGELCPVGDLQILRGERILYQVYEYGRDQLFELTDEELAVLRAGLVEAGLAPALIAPMPVH